MNAQTFPCSFQHALSKEATHEALNFLYDTVQWRHLVSNDNAALLLPLADEMSDTPPPQEMVVEGGFERIPVMLVDEFLRHHK